MNFNTHSNAGIQSVNATTEDDAAVTMKTVFTSQLNILAILSES